MLRCCHPGSSTDFRPSYASALVAPDEPSLKRAVEKMEASSPICPCVTAWCKRCKKVSTIVTDLRRFQEPSAFYAHALVSRQAFEETFGMCSKKK
jgi:hypothetical protein